MNPRWIIKMAQIARNPPSGKRLWIMLAVAAICLALYGMEQFFGWSPDTTSLKPPRLQ